MSNNLGDLVEGQPNANIRKAREFAGFKGRIRYTGHNFHMETDVRYSKVETDPAFELSGVTKTGPNKLPIRWDRGGEWRVYEIQPDGSEKEITSDQVRYWQETEPGKEPTEINPLDATKVIDVSDSRPLEECTLDGPISYGTLVPREKVNEFGPNRDDGSKLYKLWGEDVAAYSALLGFSEMLDKERLAVYYPFVFRRGMTVHLVCGWPVRVNGNVYLHFMTFGGAIKLDKPLNVSNVPTKVEERKPILAKPMLKRKAAGVQ